MRRVGVDETASKRGQNYITTFVDLDTSTLIFATEGRSAATLADFRADLERHGCRPEQIKAFCIDMSAAFRKGIEITFPAAEITFDKFHIREEQTKGGPQRGGPAT